MKNGEVYMYVVVRKNSDTDQDLLYAYLSLDKAKEKSEFLNAVAKEYHTVERVLFVG